MKKYHQGFTLVELLVVIAIIGILAAVVLISLNLARKKGSDTRVISDVQQIHTQLEEDIQNDSYDLNLGVNSLLDSAISGSNIQSLIDDATSTGGNIFIITNPTPPITRYALFGELPSYGPRTGATDTATFFCRASDGTSNQQVTGSSTLSLSCQ